MPSEAISDMWFTVEVNGSWYTKQLSVWWGNHTVYGPVEQLNDPDTTITVEPLYINKTWNMSLHNARADGVEELVYVNWGLGNITDLNPVGQSYTQPGRLMGFVPLEWIGGRYVATLTIPPVVPSGAAVFLVGTVVFYDGPIPETVHKLVSEIRPIPPNRSPRVVVTSDRMNVSEASWVSTTGTVDDEGGAVIVEARLDSGPWEKISNAFYWNWSKQKEGLAAGNHTLEVRAFDGELYSPIVTFDFTIDIAEKKEKDAGPGFSFFLMVVAIILALLFKRRHMSFYQ
jgi:hypothetical protein